MHRRRIPRLRILTCTLLGLLTTIAVSWALTVKQPDIRYAWDVVRPRIPARGEGDGLLRLQLLTAFGYRGYGGGPHPDDSFARRLRVFDPERMCPAWARRHLLPWCEGTEPWPATPHGPGRHIILTGWPFPCLYTVWSSRPGATAQEWAALERAGWQQWSPGAFVRGGIFWIDDDYMPVLPRPLPIAANTLFYGGLWFALFLTPAIIRRAFHRPGTCSHCAYDLRGLPAGAPCPECGKGEQVTA